MRPDIERPAESGNSQRAYDESAPSESITESVPRAPVRHQDAPGPSTPQEREVRARQARKRLREAAFLSRVGRALNVMCADMGDRDPSDAFAPSEGWTRNLGNELVTAWGFDAGYVSCRYGLTRRTGANA